MLKGLPSWIVVACGVLAEGRWGLVVQSVKCKGISRFGLWGVIPVWFWRFLGSLAPLIILI